MQPHIQCDVELRAYTVRATDKQRIGVARCLEVEDAAESTDFGVGARATRRAHVWFYSLNERVSRID